MSRLPDGRIKFEPGELPPVAMSLSTTAWNATGAWRSREPIFRDLRPPCSAGCPAGQNVADQLRLVAQGRMRDAGEVILERNPFPAITGRVCPHPCTALCNRRQLEGPLDVPGIERAVGDALLESSYVPPRRKRNGTRVAVIGAGPAGLAAAHFLARDGLSVTIFEREEKPGGLLWSGIPPWRLPRAIASAEIARALEGVELKTGRGLGGDLTIESLRLGHDAIVVAIGRHGARKLGIPGEEHAIDGLTLLRTLHLGKDVPGQRVVVIGGGNTALDCARSLLRFGRDVQIVYRRTRADMPAFAEELEEIDEERIGIIERAMPTEIADGGVRFVKNRGAGRGKLEPIPDSEFFIEADLVVAAAGEEIETQIEDVPGVWKCGDCAGGGTVAEAIGQARKVAGLVAHALGAASAPVELDTQVVAPERIRAPYFERIEPAWRPRLPVTARGPEDEVRLGFDDARIEARRCLSCGTCTGCDNCITVCAERAVIRGAPGAYSVDPKRCKGCGVCVEECPRGAATLREVGGDNGQ